MGDHNEGGRFLVLPSNTPSIIEGQNKTSHFVIQLEKPWEFGNEAWEVSLLEINYPHSWEEDVPRSKCSYRLGLESIVGGAHIQWGPCSEALSKRENISKEPSDGLRSLLKRLNDNRPERPVVGQFNIKKGKTIIQLRSSSHIKMSRILAETLGFQKKEYSYADGTRNEGEHIYTITAEHRPDLKANMYNIFVYCNLVKESLVGDRMVKLLRTVPVDPHQDRGKYITRTFNPLRYIELSSSFFQNIEILLTDDLGDPVRFEWGKVIIHLHLRKRKH